MKFKLSILDDKLNYSKKVANVKEVVELDSQTDIDSIKYYFGHTIHSPYQWNNGVRNSENFIETNALFLDFDESISINDWKKSVFSKFNQIIYVSRSHQLLKDDVIVDRFHVLLLLDKTLTVGKEVTNMLIRIRNILAGMGYKLDKCIDVSRYIFPSRYEGNENVNSYFENEFEIINNKVSINNERINDLFVELNIEDNFVEDSQVDKIKKNVDYQYKLEENLNEDYNVGEAIKVLMSVGNELEHEERFTIAVALYNLYGENGKQYLLNIKNSEGTIRCWDSAKMKKYSEIGVGSLFFIAKKYGFNFFSNTDILKKDLQEKYDPIKSLLKSQKITQKENEKKVLEIQLENIIESLTKEEKEIKVYYDRKISETFSNEELSDGVKEIQQKMFQSDKKNKIEAIVDKYSKEKKVIDKKLAGFDKEVESELNDVDKEVSKEMEVEFKKKEKELKKSQNEDQSRKKLELLTNGITDLKRYVGEKFSHHWEQASQLHKDCKIFLAPDGKYSKLIKFSDKGEFGSVMLLKGLEWSGIVETSYKYTYKITSGFFNAEKDAIVDVDFSKMDFSTQNRIINNEFDKYDNFYLRGEVRLQITPNLEIKNPMADEFEQLFRYTFGDFSDFLLKFISMVVFEDRKEARPVVVFNGVRGTGKSLFMGLFKYLYGESSKEFNEGEFNSYANAKIITVDEKYSNRKELWDTIKRTTGNKTVTVRPLYSNPIECDSISYYIVASNDRPIKITEAPESAKDNQVYAVTLTKPFSDNTLANSYYKKNKDERDKDVLSFLTNRLGAWLQTKGMELFTKIVEDRNGSDILRYGIRVPITKTLLDWCESGYPDEFKKPLMITANLMSNKNSIMVRAFKQGFISKKFYENANVDPLLIVEFFRKLRDKALLETNTQKFMINEEEKTGFKIRNVFQLLLWLKPFLDEEDGIIEDLLSSVVYKVDNIHYDISTKKNHIIHSVTPSVIPSSVIASVTPSVIPSVTQNNTTNIISSNVIPSVTENNTTNIISSNIIENVTLSIIPSITNDDIRYLFTTPFKNSIYNTNILSNNDDDTDVFNSMFEVKIKPKNYTDITNDEYDKLVKQNVVTNINNRRKYDTDNILPMSPQLLKILNKAVTESDDTKLVNLFNDYNKMDDEYKFSMSDEEYKTNESEFLYYMRKAIEELNERKSDFTEWRKASDIYEFYQKYKQFNIFLTLERIKQSCNYLSILLDELNIKITNTSSEMFFLLFYRLLAH